jgi:hypothetical protein
MASFCKQCSIDVFGKDFGDMKDLGPAGELAEDEGWLCLCEDCGLTIVSQDGTCINAGCFKHHGAAT